MTSTIIGSGTITVDHANVALDSTASTQTVDLFGGRLSAPLTLEATIKDWNSDGRVVFGGASSVNSVQFNQTSDAGGDLQLFGASGAQVGDLHLLGTYATSDLTITPLRGASDISASGITPVAVRADPCPRRDVQAKLGREHRQSQVETYGNWYYTSVRVVWRVPAGFRLPGATPRQSQAPPGTHEILCRFHTEFVGYPARSLSM